LPQIVQSSLSFVGKTCLRGALNVFRLFSLANFLLRTLLLLFTFLTSLLSSYWQYASQQ